MIKIINKLFIYISLLFVVIYLYSSETVKFISISNGYLFILSILLLLFGHIMYVYSWYYLLKKFKIKKMILFESESITIFNKYIPGKIWVVLGPVAYLKKYYDISLKEVSQYSMYLQILIIWTGLMLGILFIFLLPSYYLISYIVLLLFFSLYLFSNTIHNIIEKIIFRITKKQFFLLKLCKEEVFIGAILTLFMWLIWSFAFYIFILSTAGNIEDLSILVAFIFPISGVIGVVALLSPGGLGVREGVMVMLLIIIGIPSIEATQISIDSRIWFLIGEFLIFFLSFVSIFSRKYIIKE